MVSSQRILVNVFMSLKNKNFNQNEYIPLLDFPSHTPPLAPGSIEVQESSVLHSLKGETRAVYLLALHLCAVPWDKIEWGELALSLVWILADTVSVSNTPGYFHLDLLASLAIWTFDRSALFPAQLSSWQWVDPPAA